MDQDTHEQILKELRSQIRIANRLNTFWLIIFVIILISYGAICTGYFDRRASQSWYDVHYFMDKGDYDKALSTALSLLGKTPGDANAHLYVARIYRIKCDYANAVKHYSRAYDLFPTRENEEYFSVTRKLMERSLKDTSPTK